MISRILEKLQIREPNRVIQEDCLSCKILGTGTFGGLSVYTLYQRSKIPKVQVVHRGFVAGLSLIFAGVAVTRAII
jgi:hypothetical protein